MINEKQDVKTMLEDLLANPPKGMTTDELITEIETHRDEYGNVTLTNWWWSRIKSQAHGMD